MAVALENYFFFFNVYKVYSFLYGPNQADFAMYL